MAQRKKTKSQQRQDDDDVESGGEDSTGLASGNATAITRQTRRLKGEQGSETGSGDENQVGSLCTALLTFLKIQEKDRKEADKRTKLENYKRDDARRADEDARLRARIAAEDKRERESIAAEDNREAARKKEAAERDDRLAAQQRNLLKLQLELTLKDEAEARKVAAATKKKKKKKKKEKRQKWIILLGSMRRRDDLEENTELLECCFDRYKTPQQVWADYLFKNLMGLQRCERTAVSA